MYLKKVDIINFFDDVMKREILKFCQRINESDADVFILMARKAACFFQVLIESGYIDYSITQKMIVTDRSTDFSNKYLKGKKILIIDDVIFSGTTIAKMVRLLQYFGVELNNISILILALNRDTFRMHFTSNGEKKELFRIDESAKLNNADCTKLCGNISRMLSVIGKPYDVDFPAYHDIYLRKKDIMPWAVLPQFWTLYNVSNEYQNQTGIEAYMLIPSDRVLVTIWKYTGMDLSEIAEYKIRVYGLENEEEKRYKILPMVVFNEISFDTLEIVFKKMCEQLGFINTKLMDSFKNESAKMRLMQYYIANLLYYSFINTCKLEVPELRKYSLPYLFGYDYLDEINSKLKSSLHSYAEQFNNIAVDNSKTVQRVYCSNEINTLGYKYSEDVGMNSFDINMKLLNPFIYWFKKKELPTREKLADSNINLDNENIFKNDFRLEVGFSFRSLKIFLYHAREYYDIDNLISVFIDRAVDLGLLVPIIFIDKEKQTICRAFRHGEDLPFGDSDRAVLLYFLKVLYGHIDYKKIPHIQFQKIVVLFIQLGIRENLFNIFLGFDNSQLLTVKYCIHGAVPVVVDKGAKIDNLHPYVKKDNYSEWLSERLIKNNVMKQDETGISIVNIESPADNVCLSREITDKTNMIALMIAEWYNISVKSNRKSVFSDNIIMLTSCLNIEAFASAILAELYICRSDWEGNLKEIIKDSDSNTYARCRRYFLHKMRASNVFAAMNSGRRKFLWFLKDEEGNNQVQEVVNNIADLLKNNGKEFEALYWNTLWGSYLSVNQSQDFIDNDIMECVGHIYCYNICYRILEYLIIHGLKATAEQESKIINEIEELKNEYDLLPLRQPRISELLMTTKYKRAEAINGIYNYMLDLDKKVEEDMLVIEQYISKNSNQYMLKYHSCIIFDFDIKKCDDCLNIINENLPNHNFDRHIVFSVGEKNFTRILVAAEGNKSQEVLLKFIGSVYRKAMGVKIHCIVIPVLPIDKEFRLNIKINSQANVADFKQKIIIPLEKLFNCQEPRTDEILFVTKQGDYENEPRIEYKEILESSGLTLNCQKMDNVNIPYCKEGYSYMKYSNSEIVVGIIAIIPEEFNAVKNRYSMKKIPFSDERNSKRIFYESYVSADGKDFHLILTQAQGQGNQAGTSAYYGLNMNFRVDYVILIGIAGSVNEKDAKIGDVVIARSVYDGQLGKETDGGFRPETKVYSPNAIVNSIILDYMNEANGKSYKSSNNDFDETFSCIYEPIGNNNHLIATKQSEFVNNLKENVERKIAAVEMESAGVAYGVYQGALEGLCERLIVIRGISDYADQKKSPNNQYHAIASENAVTIFHDMLKYL